MTDQDWAKEPWEYEEADPLQGFIVNNAGDEITYPVVAINPKHLPRIAACVSACAGVPTEDLALGILATYDKKADDMLDKFDTMLKQSKQILASLEKEAPND